MTLALVLLFGGLSVLAAILWARATTAQNWRASLLAYRLTLPATLTADDVARWLSAVAASTHPPRWSLLVLPPVGLEVRATSHGIAHYLLVSSHSQARILPGLRAALPGVRIEAAPEYLASRPPFRIAAEATLTSVQRPLAFERAEAASTALLATLQPVGMTSEVRVQFICTSAGTPAPVMKNQEQDDSSLPWWLEREAPADSDALRAARIKQREPLLMAVLRVGVASQHQAEAYDLFGRVWGTLHTSNSPGVRLVRRWLPSSTVAARLAERRYPLTRWPFIVNAQEASAFTAFPMGGVALPGLALGAARQLPPSPNMPMHGSVLAVSNYPGNEDRPLALLANDRLRHSFVLGPTGSGKSWLLSQLILQDIAAGYGVVAVDVKGDLVGDICDRISDHDAERVIVLDASKRQMPIGFNVLGTTRSEEGRELAVDNVLHIFKEIWAAFWGPRSDQIMRAALSTLVHSRAPDGSAFTLCEIVPLLNQAGFRRTVLASAELPLSLRGFWQWYESLSDGERTQAIGPIINKVEAFTSRTPIRLMLGQSRGLDLTTVFTERRALLISLAKGSLGSETSALLGSLLVSSLWQATLSRVNVPAEKRRPTFAYLDEMQDIVRLPLSLSDMLAQARGLGLGITLATQFMAQIPEHLRAAVLGTVRTLLTFQLDHDDARLLAKRFAPLTTDDLMGLMPYEVAVKPCVNGQVLTPVTGGTVPLPPWVRDGAALAEASRQRYGVARREVEEALQARLSGTATGHEPGRGWRGARS